MEAISSSNGLGNYSMSQGRVIIPFSITRNDQDPMIQSSYLTEIVDLISPVIHAIKRYRRSNGSVGMPQILENVQNSTMAENLSDDEKEIKSLEKEITERKDKNRNALKELIVKEKVLEDIYRAVLTSPEHFNKTLKNFSEINSIKINNRMIMVDMLNKAIDDLECD